MTDPSDTPPPADNPAPAVPAQAGPAPAHARHAAAPSAQDRQRQQRLRIGGAVAALIVVVVVIVVLVGGSSPNQFDKANPGQSAKVTSANAKALCEIDTYNAAIKACGSKIACIETANRKLGDEVHLYANYVGSLKQKGSTAKTIDTALNTAQITGNTLEILGDALPTKANYDQVLHHFDLAKQISSLRTAINNLAGVV